jgi:hypothetical protein
VTDTPDTPDPDRPEDEPGLSLDAQLDAILAEAGAEQAFKELDDQAASAGADDGKKSQATRLVELARRTYRTVLGSDGKTYAVPLAGPNTAMPLRGDVTGQLVM